MTGKYKNTRIFSIEKCSFIRVFTKLNFKMYIFLYTEKKHKQKTEERFPSNISQAAIRDYL